MSSTPMLTLRMTLRAATAAGHEALERTGLLREFSSPNMAAAAYADYIVRQWRLHSAMEPVLKRWLGPNWAAARLVKSRWLDQDLAVLQCVAEAQEIVWCPPANVAQAFGTMYVLEGATLGIRHSVRSLPITHPANGPANRFIQGYGERTGARWKETLALLEQVDPALWPDVVVGASTAFRAFNAHFSEGTHAEFDTSVSA